MSIVFFFIIYSLFGYGASYMHQENNMFSYFWLQKLECNGNERSIDECVKTDEFIRTLYIDIDSWFQDYGSKLYCVGKKIQLNLICLCVFVLVSVH
jgi:hypothetical protein